MKSINILATLVLILFFSHSANAQKTPLEMNDRLIAVTDSLYNLSKAWSAELSEGVATHNYTNAKTSRLKLEAYIGRETVRLKALKDIKTSKPLRELMLSFLEFEKTIAATTMKPFEAINDATTEEEIQKLTTNLQNVSAQEEAYLDKIMQAQEKYAQENGFTIEG